MSVACSQCGAESTLDETYAVETSVLGQKRRFCPPCWHETHERRARGALAGVVVVAVGALGALALERSSHGEASAWFALNLCLLFLFLEIATLPHELGHALMAHALGFRVFSISAGVGPRILDRNVRGVRFRLHAYPFGGFTVSAPRDRRFFRLKQVLVIAAGPAVNGLLVAYALLPGRELRVGAIIDGPCPALALLVANATLLVMNLLPIKVASPAGLAMSDGLALLKVPFMGAAGVTEVLAVRYTLEAQAFRERESLQGARSWAERGLGECPDSPLLHFDLGFTLVLLGDCEGARHRFLAAAEAKGAPPALRALALNNIAWVDAMTAANDRLDEADRLSQEALRMLGFVPALKGTRGAVLIALGRSDEGVALLRDVLREARDDGLHPMARAGYAGALVLGLVAQGRLAEANEFLPAARGYGGRSPLLGRVEAAIAEASRDATAAGGSTDHPSVP